MSPKDEIEVRKASPANTMVIGALVGAGAGVVAAMLLHRRAKNRNEKAPSLLLKQSKSGCWFSGYFAPSRHWAMMIRL